MLSKNRKPFVQQTLASQALFFSHTLFSMLKCFPQLYCYQSILWVAVFPGYPIILDIFNISVYYNPGHAPTCLGFLFSHVHHDTCSLYLVTFCNIVMDFSEHGTASGFSMVWLFVCFALVHVSFPSSRATGCVACVIITLTCFFTLN